MQDDANLDRAMPRLLTPANGVDDSPCGLAAWVRENAHHVDRILDDEGALLCRSFHVESPDAFRAVVTALRPRLRPYVGGDSPRHALGGGLYTSTEFPAHMTIGLHNELSYARSWPERLFFGCLEAAASGGETPIADGRQVRGAMNPAVLERFTRHGVIYRQHLRDAALRGPGKSWQESFETSDRREVERLCADQGMEARWTARGLRTSLRNPGVVAHQRSGATCWFNQADLWHARFDTVKAQERASEDDRLGCHALYGDGSEIAAEDLEAVREAYGTAKIRFPWQKGDVLMLDNVLMLHGREPFEGERRVLVAMA